MACCALKKQKKHWMILPVFLFLSVGALGGIFLSVLIFLGIFFPNIKEKRDKSLQTYKELLKGLSNKILREPFIFNTELRCKISGKIMKLSTPIAGAVYKYFNLGVLAMAAISILLVLVGLTAFGI